jgi:hypothetical protein
MRRTTDPMRPIGPMIEGIVAEVLGRVALRHAGADARPDQLGGGPAETRDGSPRGVSSLDLPPPVGRSARHGSRRRDFRGVER